MYAAGNENDCMCILLIFGEKMLHVDTFAVFVLQRARRTKRSFFPWLVHGLFMSWVVLPSLRKGDETDCTTCPCYVCVAACPAHEEVFLPMDSDPRLSGNSLVQAGHSFQHAQQDELPGNLVCNE